MKTLYVVRHAKSSWEDMSLSDHDRPLLPVGIKKTNRVAGYLTEKEIIPDLFISSSAIRAHETARIIAEKVGYPDDEIIVNPNLYHASSETIFDELYGLADDIESVMIFGHNPTFTYFVNKFLDIPIDNLPTSGMVSITFFTDRWENISNTNFKVNFIVTPKLLK